MTQTGPFDADDIDAAVTAGVFDAAQAARFSAFLAARRGATGHADEEALRFVTSFNDIFVTLGIGLVMGPVLYFLTDGPAWLAGVFLAGLSWALAEIFTRRRRMAFPSIVLLIAFAVSAFAATGASLRAFEFEPTADRDPSLRIAGAALLTATLVSLHWLRFRVPITVAVGVAALCVLALALVAAVLPEGLDRRLDLVVFALGLLVFALAMRFDMSDLARVTRSTDIAFWLHLLAAPMIVHGALSILLGGGAISILGFLGLGDPRGAIGAAQSAAPWTLAIIAALSVVALVVDRRALLVSGLTSAGVALHALITEAGLFRGETPVTVLGLGLIVLVLSVAWQPLRAIALAPLPEALRRCVPRARGA